MRSHRGGIREVSKLDIAGVALQQEALQNKTLQGGITTGGMTGRGRWRSLKMRIG